jgi:hypothetical protein
MAKKEAGNVIGSLGDLAKVETDEKRELAMKRSSYEKIVEELRAFVIEDDDDYEYASKLLRTIKATSKEIEERRKRVTGPLYEALRNFQSWYKPALDVLENGERDLKKKIADYYLLKEAQREEQMRLVAAAAREGNFEKAHEAAQGFVETPTAKGISIQRKWEYEVEDITKVPREFLTLDHSAVKIYIKNAGEDDPKPIPGLKFTKSGGVTAKT